MRVQEIFKGYFDNYPRDYNVIVDPSWVWTYYASESDYGRNVSNGLIAKSEHTFTVLEALTPSCVVSNQQYTKYI